MNGKIDFFHSKGGKSEQKFSPLLVYTLMEKKIKLYKHMKYVVWLIVGSLEEVQLSIGWHRRPWKGKRIEDICGYLDPSVLCYKFKRLDSNSGKFKIPFRSKIYVPNFILVLLRLS